LYNGKGIRFRRAIIETVGGSSLSKFATEAVVLHSTFEAFFFFQEYLIVPKAPVTVPAVTMNLLQFKQVASDLLIG
jgi:hypothetical protein